MRSDEPIMVMVIGALVLINMLAISICIAYLMQPGDLPAFKGLAGLVFVGILDWIMYRIIKNGEMG